MTPATLADSHVQAALRHGVHALQRVANYALPAALDRRLQHLGENKEYLEAAEHEELLALVRLVVRRPEGYKHVSLRMAQLPRPLRLL